MQAAERGLRRAERRVSFAFETTLSGRSHLALLRKLKAEGYDIHFFFLWLKSVELALSRVKERVSRGGHDVPEPVVRRRFDRSMQNFLLYYRPLAKVWTLFDNSGEWNYFRWMLVGSGVLCVGQARRLNKANKTPSSACKSTIDSRMDPQHPRRDLVQELSHLSLFAESTGAFLCS